MFNERMRDKDIQWVRPHSGPFIWNKIEKEQGKCKVIPTYIKAFANGAEIILMLV